MSVKILAGHVSGGRKGRLTAACLYDAATMTAFGPLLVLENAAGTIEEVAALGDEFIEFVEAESGRDPRKVEDKELHTLLIAFLSELAKEENEDNTKGGAA